MIDRARKHPAGFAFDAVRAGVAASVRAGLRAAVSASETLESLEEAREKLFGEPASEARREGEGRLRDERVPADEAEETEEDAEEREP